MIIVLALCAAFAAGTASALYAVTHWLEIAGRQSGPWMRLTNINSPQKDPYLRAFQHVSSQFPIGDAEGQSYVASKDGGGQLLDPSCDYTVEGNIPPARLFTLHSETTDGQLIMADAPFESAMHSDQMLFRGKTFAISVSSTVQPDNWLALQTNAPFNLILTYYDVAVINDDTGNSISLPDIVKQGCPND
jgi:hypothetical protein